MGCRGGYIRRRVVGTVRMWKNDRDYGVELLSERNPIWAGVFLVLYIRRDYRGGGSYWSPNKWSDERTNERTNGQTFVIVESLSRLKTGLTIIKASFYRIFFLWITFTCNKDIYINLLVSWDLWIHVLRHYHQNSSRTAVII